MANGNWQQALGAMLLTGNQLMARNRLEKVAEEDREQEKKERLLRMALMEEDQELQRQSAGRADREEKRATARQLLADLGPGAAVSDTDIPVIEAGGYGSRVSKPTLDAEAFRPDAAGDPVSVDAPGGTRSVIPTRMEQLQLDHADASARERDQQERARQAVNDPKFYKAPREQRQVIWTQAGFPGQVPETFDEAKRMIDHQASIRNRELGIMYPSDRFGTDARGTTPEARWLDSYRNNLMRVTALVQEQARSLASQGQPVDVKGMMTEAARIAQEHTEQLMGPKPQGQQDFTLLDENFVGPPAPANSGWTLQRK